MDKAENIILPEAFTEIIALAHSVDARDGIEELSSFTQTHLIPALQQENLSLGYKSEAAYAKALADAYQVFASSIEARKVWGENLISIDSLHEQLKKMHDQSVENTKPYVPPPSKFQVSQKTLDNAHLLDSEWFHNQTGKLIQLYEAQGMQVEDAEFRGLVEIADVAKANDSKDALEQAIVAFHDNLVEENKKYSTVYAKLNIDTQTFKSNESTANKNETQNTPKNTEKLSFLGPLTTLIGSIGLFVASDTLSKKGEPHGTVKEEQSQKNGWFRPALKWFAAILAITSAIELSGRVTANKSLIIGPMTALVAKQRSSSPSIHI